MRKSERGMTLAEVLVSLAIVSVIVVFSGRMLSVAYRGTQINMNKQFATQKALSMLEELKALVQSEGDGANGSVLDSYDDGTTNQTILTTQSGVTKPDAPVSGNTDLGKGKWLFERRITVQKVPGANDLRLVRVAVYVNDIGGTRLIAEVASVLSTIGQNSPPTQVYDLYLVAIENVPGWWVYMENVVPFVESAMLDLESRHAGLKFRRHWIRKLSYGRDPYYTPFVNSVAEAVDVAKQRAGDRNVVVASAKIAQQCLDAGLLDQIAVDLVPVLLGAGVRWFDNLGKSPVRLSDPAIVQGRGVTHLAYTVQR